MKISILTLFPEMFVGPFDCSIVARARGEGHVTINIVNIRDFATDKHKSVDDRPYGGGVGMILRVDVIDRALTAVKQGDTGARVKTILLDPQGVPFQQKTAKRLSKVDHLILLCGHYEGVDERVRAFVDEEISIGDYVLSGGEIPALVVTDALVRLIPGVLPKDDATVIESFSEGVLEYAQYTRPPEYKGMSVPAVLTGGNHAEIAKWQTDESTSRTNRRRPDLIAQASRGKGV